MLGEEIGSSGPPPQISPKSQSVRIRRSRAHLTVERPASHSVFQVALCFRCEQCVAGRAPTRRTSYPPVSLEMLSHGMDTLFCRFNRPDKRKCGAIDGGGREHKPTQIEELQLRLLEKQDQQGITETYRSRSPAQRVRAWKRKIACQTSSDGVSAVLQTATLEPS